MPRVRGANRLRIPYAVPDGSMASLLEGNRAVFVCADWGHVSGSGSPVSPTMNAVTAQRTEQFYADVCLLAVWKRRSSQNGK